MYLEGQANQRGYAMAAVLVAIALMAVVMSALLPAWRQQVQREKEAELAFRGEQYARAIYLFKNKNGGMNPPSIDALVQGRFIRKKYKDPFTEDGEFQTLAAGQQQNQPGPGGGTPVGGGTSTFGASRGGAPVPPAIGSGVQGGAMSGGGILTVRSKSKQASIRIYNGGAHYNEWNFIYRARGGNPMGGPGQGSPVPGGRGGAPGVGRPGTPGGPGGTGPRGGPGGTGPGRGPGGLGPGRGPLPAPGFPGRGGRGSF